MEALQVLKFHVKQSNSLDFSEGITAEKEIHELELDSERAGSIPDDIESYLKKLLLN